MAISIAGSDTFQSGHGAAGSASATFTYPGAMVAGDLIFISVWYSFTVTTPTGYTLVASHADTTAGNGNSNSYVYAKFATSGDVAAGTVTVSSASGSGAVTMVGVCSVRHGNFTSVAANVVAGTAGAGGDNSSITKRTSAALTSVPFGAWLMTSCTDATATGTVPTLTASGSNWTTGVYGGYDYVGTSVLNIGVANNVVESISAAPAVFTWSAGFSGTAGGYLITVPWYLFETPVGNVVSTTAASATSITINAPASLNIGQLLLAVIGNVTGSSALVQPSGWTALDNPAGAIGSAYHIVDGTEPSSWTWNWTGASVSCGLIAQIPGGSYYPIDAHNAQANASSGNLVAPALTPSWNSDTLVSVYIDIAANTITVPATQTGRSLGSSVGNSRSIVLGWEALGSNASTGTRTATATAAVNYGFSFLIRPPEPAILLPAGNVPYAGVLAFRDGAISGAGVNSPIGAGSSWFSYSPLSQGYSGTASISGTVEVGGVPSAGFWVYLSPMSSQGSVIGAAYTNANGLFSFASILPGLYLVECVDPTGTYDALIYSNVVAY